MRKLIAIAAVLAAACAGMPAVRGADAVDPTKSTVGGTGPIKDELTSEVRASVKRGLAWLAKVQSKDGSFGGTGGGGYADGSQPGIAALAGLALMADGNMPDQGPYGKEVSKVLDYVLNNTQESGLIAGGQMYGHGFGTLFLAEAYGTTQRPDVKEKLQKAIRLIVSCQNLEGGWRYTPAPLDADISVTICQVMALRAARNAGISVPASTIDKAVEYVKKSQEPDGGFSYMLQSRGSAFPRSAAGVACLFYMGKHQTAEVNNGVKYLMRQLPGQGENRNDYHYYYGNYYATQAMFLAGGDAWSTYWPLLSKDLTKRQTPDGSWSGDAGNVYATSMALIMLQVPNRLLPILQK
jgi:squalene cyclase